MFGDEKIVEKIKRKLPYMFLLQKLKCQNLAKSEWKLALYENKL